MIFRMEECLQLYVSYLLPIKLVWIFFFSTSDEQVHSELFNEELGLIIQYKGEVDELSNKLTEIGCSIENVELLPRLMSFRFLIGK